MVAGLLLIALLPQAPSFSEFLVQYQFGQITTFRCQFTDGEGRLFGRQATANRRGERIAGDIVLDQINYTERTARLIGNAGADAASVFDGDLAATVIVPTVPFGGLVITTVFKTPIAPGVYRAGMSRHLPLATGDFNVTQLYGTCRGLP